MLQNEFEQALDKLINEVWVDGYMSFTDVMADTEVKAAREKIMELLREVLLGKDG